MMKEYYIEDTKVGELCKEIQQLQWELLENGISEYFEDFGQEDYSMMDRKIRYAVFKSSEFVINVDGNGNINANVYPAHVWGVVSMLIESEYYPTVTNTWDTVSVGNNLGYNVFIHASEIRGCQISDNGLSDYVGDILSLI